MNQPEPLENGFMDDFYIYIYIYIIDDLQMIYGWFINDL